MIISLLGSSGNMGEKTFSTLLKEDYIEKIKILGHQKKSTKSLLKKNKKYKNKIEVIYGSIADKEVVRELIKDSDYVINMAAVIPPLSDKAPLKAIEANEIGVKNLVEAIEEIKLNQPKFIHISTVGLYGDRNYNHPFGEVGDPLLLSPFDIYAVTKMRGEFTVLESNIKERVILRQSAMLYDKMLMKNVSDGLMFHTCFNSPLEWTTANDSAFLIRNILRKDKKEWTSAGFFWKKCFNIGAKVENRVTGFETLDLGFKIIGCSTYDFFDTNYNSLRNFHGLWFSDGYKLEELFNYQNDVITDFWDNVLKTHPYFKLAYICPKKLMKKLVIKRLLKDTNSPTYWYKHNDEARMKAYFKSKEDYENIPKEWDKFNLLINNKGNDGKDIDYNKLRNTPTHLNHFFDINKNVEEVTIEDLRNVASAHGGKLLTEDFKTGDVYRKVEWENQDKERFVARPYSVLYCGHWMNITYKEYAWDFDRLSKKDKVYAQIWYDSHDKDEDNFYYYDENFKACYRKINK